MFCINFFFISYERFLSTVFLKWFISNIFSLFLCRNSLTLVSQNFLRKLVIGFDTCAFPFSSNFFQKKSFPFFLVSFPDLVWKFWMPCLVIFLFTWIFFLECLRNNLDNFVCKRFQHPRFGPSFQIHTFHPFFLLNYFRTVVEGLVVSVFFNFRGSFLQILLFFVLFFSKQTIFLIIFLSLFWRMLVKFSLKTFFVLKFFAYFFSFLVNFRSYNFYLRFFLGSVMGIFVRSFLEISLRCSLFSFFFPFFPSLFEANFKTFSELLVKKCFKLIVNSERLQFTLTEGVRIPIRVFFKRFLKRVLRNSFLTFILNVLYRFWMNVSKCFQCSFSSFFVSCILRILLTNFLKNRVGNGFSHLLEKNFPKISKSICICVIFLTESFVTGKYTVIIFFDLYVLLRIFLQMFSKIPVKFLSSIFLPFSSTVTLDGFLRTHLQNVCQLFLTCFMRFVWGTFLNNFVRRSVTGSFRIFASRLFKFFF